MLYDHPFGAEDEFELETFENESNPEIALHDKGFYGCTFTNIDWSQGELRRCTFDDCTFVNCNLTMVKAYDTTFREVTFQRTKLMGVDWTLVRPLTFEVSFEDCVLSYGSFVEVRLKGTSFLHCVAKEADFTEAILEKAKFRGTTLTGATFENTVLTQADLSEAKDYTIDPRRNKLDQTQFSLEAVLRVAAQLGIQVPEMTGAHHKRSEQE
ncbi:MAG: pentapeptide repeat-containing protein [Deltaproteobacteria bacterium]|nr:MAG: pentapeptide repeat-containing protein [Deltaproteobacteria bacterium]